MIRFISDQYFKISKTKAYNTMTKKYVTNKYDHYFLIDVASFDITMARNCKQHESMAAMYGYVCASGELSPDEVEGMEIVIEQAKKEITISTHGRCIPIKLSVNQTLEDLVANYQV